jgi:hypothetical protein
VLVLKGRGMISLDRPDAMLQGCGLEPTDKLMKSVHIVIFAPRSPWTCDRCSTRQHRDYEPR